MQEWLNNSSSYWSFVILTLIEILVVAYFLTKNPKYRLKIFWTSIYAAVLAILVTSSTLIISHYQATFFSLILAFVILPLTTGLIAGITYFGIVLFSFVFGFFTPVRDRPKEKPSLLEPIIIGLIGIIVAIKLIASPYGLEDLKWLLFKNNNTIESNQSSQTMSPLTLPRIGEFAMMLSESLATSINSTDETTKTPNPITHPFPIQHNPS